MHLCGRDPLGALSVSVCAIDVVPRSSRLVAGSSPVANSDGGGLNPIRILSLDGGGTWAGILARALGEIYGADTPGRDIIRQFDFVAGNSGGSLVFTALCCDYTPKEVAGLYDDPATLKYMFCPKLPWRWIIPRYSSHKKAESLRNIFDRKRKPGEPIPSTIKITDWPGLLGSRVNLIVTGFDYERRRATFFRSNTASLAKSSTTPVDATLVQAVHASTNAPIIYFDEPAEFERHRYWDGALGAYNNPVLAAVIEALANRGAEADAFRVLSVGTGTCLQPLTTEGVRPPLGKEPPDSGLVDALRVVATVIVDDPPDAASFHAHVALRQRLPAPGGTYSDGTLVRISPIVRPVWKGAGGWHLPNGLNEREFQELVEMDMDVMERHELDLIKKMVDLWFRGDIPNQPIRMGEHFRCDVGHDKFSDAVAHWRLIS